MARFKQDVLLVEYSTDRFARRGSGPSDLCRPAMTARKAGFGLIWACFVSRFFTFLFEQSREFSHCCIYVFDCSFVLDVLAYSDDLSLR